MSVTGLAFFLFFVGASGASLLVASGAVSFYLYQFVYMFAPTQRWWGESLPGLPFSFIASSLLLLAVVIQYEKTRYNHLIRIAPFWWLVAIVCVFVVVDFWAVLPAEHMSGLIDLIKLAVVMFCAYKLLDTPRRLEVALWFYLFGCAYIGYEAYVVGRDEFGRVEGIGPIDSPDSNGAAAVLVPAIPVFLYFVWRVKGFMRYSAMFFAILTLNALVLLNSRGAFLGILAGGLYSVRFVFFSSLISFKQRLYVFLLMIACLATALYLTDDTFWDRMSTIQSDDELESGSHRTDMWFATFDLLRDHPGGVGVYGFQHLSQIYVDPELFFDGQRFKAVHSMWFQSMAELGWIGIIVLLGLVFSTYLIMRRVRKILYKNNRMDDYFLAIAVESGLVGYLAVGTFIDQFRAQIFYWFILFCACAYNMFYLRFKDLPPVVVHETAAQRADRKGLPRFRLS